ncbi:TerC/Alx family metal homeostasis membrane protein [Auraticoccus sp. F435]|uniref:TerC/Alx family metal homeostasis membrane protein n=1 Tax=Auraticoccus cholistanensis TaxID=2656650 RepID=A0A6A9UZ82_9ACTN|nr:TerC family protein [Auraticoccus cholistanensis]MVA77254.1 TerC/Alx family metal homeostasis membrane protein [Auraticoccus cholistanensis]
MNVHLYTWVITAVVLVAVLAIDILVIGRRPHEPSMKEAGLFVSIYVALAVAFGIGVWVVSGHQYGAEFFAGWLTEYSLSLDNLFIFIIIMASLKVPRHLQQFALMVGIVLALVFRAIFIAVGAVAIERVSWIFYLFGAFLIYTAVKLVIDYSKHDDEEDVDNALLRFARKRLPFVDEYHGTKLVTHAGGRRVLTSMALVILALGSTDLLFALDSIPAIYGLTQEPYLVFTANVFALMGLRQLYFLIGGLLKRLVYLSLGLSIILAFIGVKLVLHAMHESGQYAEAPVVGPAMGAVYDWVITLPAEGEVPIWLSLAVIVGVLVVTTVASLLKSRYDRSTADGQSSLQPEGDTDGTTITEQDVLEPPATLEDERQGERPRRN